MSKCPMTALKDAAVEDVAPAAVALTLTGVAKRMDLTNVYVGLTALLTGYSAFSDAKNRARAKKDGLRKSIVSPILFVFEVSIRIFI